MAEIPLEDHPWLQPADDDARMRLHALLRQRIVDGQRAIDWEALAALDEADRARELIPAGSPWDRLFAMAHTDSYRELMLEFFMTFRYIPFEGEPPADDDDEPSEVFFSLMGQAYEMPLRVFAVRSGLYTAAETETAMYTQAIHRMDLPTLERFWFLISGRVHLGGEDRRSSDIIDPLHRYIHRVIGTSLAPRHRGREHVTDIDLFYLYCIIWRQPCQLARCLAQFYHSAYHRRVRSHLYGGAFITTLALDLGLIPAGHPLLSVPLPPTRIDIAAIRSMHLTVVIDGHPRFTDRHGHRFQPAPLPEELPQLPAQAEDVVMPDQPQQPQQPQPDHPPHPPQPPQPPQHPEHVYRVIMLPPATQAQIDGLVRDVADIRATQADIRAILGWLVDREHDRARLQGTVLPPVPGAPADQDGAGPHP